MLYLVFGIILSIWLLILMFFGFGSLVHLILGLWHSPKSSPGASESIRDEVKGPSLLTINANYREGEVGL